LESKKGYEGIVTAGSEEGINRLNVLRNTWSSILTQKSLEAEYAIIGANWVVHGAKLTEHTFALVSVAIAILHVGVYLLMAWFIYWLLDRQVDYALKDPARWEVEYERRKDPESNWPFTYAIDRTGEIHNDLKMLFPISAAVCFMMGVSQVI